MTGGGDATVTGHDAPSQARRNPPARAGLALIVVLDLLTVVLANAHLVYVAFASRPVRILSPDDRPDVGSGAPASRKDRTANRADRAE